MKNFVGRLSIFLICSLTLSACNPFQKDTPLLKENQEEKHQDSESQKDLNEDKDSAQPNTELSPKQLFQLAQMGKVNNCEFAAHINTMADVKQKWGAATSIDEVENGFYANYPSKNTVFGYKTNL